MYGDSTLIECHRTGFQNNCFTTGLKEEDFREDQEKDGQTQLEVSTGIYEMHISIKCKRGRRKRCEIALLMLFRII